MAGNNWEEKDYFPDDSDQKALYRQFSFKNFADALEFVNTVGELAEQANHHPDINLSWGRVGVWITSHDEGKITERDYKLATQIDGSLNKA